MRVIILENVRSAYNVWNIIRTADALWRDVWLSWYTPSPLDNAKVVKTSLGAENNVNLKQFDNTLQAIQFAKKNKLFVLAAEITKDSIDLKKFKKKINKWVALVLWNEVDGVSTEILKNVDQIVSIQMKGIKESLNVGQTAAIFMREIGKKITEDK